MFKNNLIKKNLVLALVCLAHASLFSQSIPKGISYQAVAINTEVQTVAGINPVNSYWSNKDIQVRFTIYDQYPGGSAQMVEIHQVTTDKFGVFNVVIGQGQNISGDLFEVEWDKGLAHLQVEIDFQNNGLYKLIGIERFWSVPYAINTSGSTSSGGSGTDLSKKLDSLVNALEKQIEDFRNQINGDIYNLKSGDTSDKNELQDLVLNGSELGMSKSNKTIDISKVIKDNEIGNELQSIELLNDTLIISGLDTFKGNIQYRNKVTLNYDKSDTNEIQYLTLRNDSLFISNSNSIPLKLSSVQSNSSKIFTYNSSQTNCLNGDFFDLSKWAQSNGWARIYPTGRLADSLYLIQVSSADRSTNGNFIFDAIKGTFTSTNIPPLIDRIDSFFYTQGYQIYKVNYRREVKYTGRTATNVKPWLNLPILNSKGDLIWVDSDKGLPLDIKKFNFATGNTSTYNNPHKGKNIGGLVRVNRDTIIIGTEVYESTSMTQLKSLPSGVFGNSQIAFTSGSFIYFNAPINSYNYSFRFDLQNGHLVKLGSPLYFRAKISNGVIADVQLGWGTIRTISGLSSNDNYSIIIGQDGSIYRADGVMYKKSFHSGLMGSTDYDDNYGEVEIPCVNGTIPNSQFGFADYK